MPTLYVGIFLFKTPTNEILSVDNPWHNFRTTLKR